MSAPTPPTTPTSRSRDAASSPSSVSSVSVPPIPSDRTTEEAAIDAILAKYNAETQAHRAAAITKLKAEKDAAVSDARLLGLFANSYFREMLDIQHEAGAAGNAEAAKQPLIGRCDTLLANTATFEAGQCQKQSDKFKVFLVWFKEQVELLKAKIAGGQAGGSSGGPGDVPPGGPSGGSPGGSNGPSGGPGGPPARPSYAQASSGQTVGETAKGQQQQPSVVAPGPAHLRGPGSALFAPIRETPSTTTIGTQTDGSISGTSPSSGKPETSKSNKPSSSKNKKKKGGQTPPKPQKPNK